MGFMHMAFADMKFPQAFWANAGLTTLFQPLEQPDEIIEATWDGVSSTSAPQQTHGVKFGLPRYHKAASVEKSAALAGGNDARKIPAKTQNGAFKLLAPELWPLEWQKQLMRAARGKIAWSYWKLGEDLQKGRGSRDGDAPARKTRGELMRRFFAELALPAGTHTFWPAALPDTDGNLVANPQVFWSGILELNCRGVVLLGSQAARALILERGIRPLDELRMLGRMVWILRDPEALAANDSWFALSVSLLRNAFRLHLH